MQTVLFPISFFSLSLVVGWLPITGLEEGGCLLGMCPSASNNNCEWLAAQATPLVSESQRGRMIDLLLSLVLLDHQPFLVISVKEEQILEVKSRINN